MSVFRTTLSNSVDFVEVTCGNGEVVRVDVRGKKWVAPEWATVGALAVDRYTGARVRIVNVTKNALANLRPAVATDFSYGEVVS